MRNFETAGIFRMVVGIVVWTVVIGLIAAQFYHMRQKERRPMPRTPVTASKSPAVRLPPQQVSEKDST